MSADAELPRCILCRKQPTADAYELDEQELYALVAEHGARTAPRVQRRYGAVPLCRPCFDGLGFGLETPRPGEESPLIRITRTRK